MFDPYATAWIWFRARMQPRLRGCLAAFLALGAAPGPQAAAGAAARGAPAPRLAVCLLGQARSLFTRAEVLDALLRALGGLQRGRQPDVCPAL